jgi:hypothetical protein
MRSEVCVPIDAAMYAEFILRSGKKVNVAGFIEQIVQDYLDRTEGDAEVWSDEHAEMFRTKLDENFEATYGDPDGFYQWDNLFLKNGTGLLMKYKGKNYFAAVRDEQIVFEDKTYTPSQLASKIANGTARNAWKDLWIKEPDSIHYVPCDDLRHRLRSVPVAGLEDF